MVDPPSPKPRRSSRAIWAESIGVAVAAGVYGLSFGVLSTTAGLSVAQTSFLSLCMFTGASQFALIGVIAAGGNPFAAAATAGLLGLRNAFYALRLNSLLAYRWPQRLLAAQLTIDESTAMAVAQQHPDDARLAFWSTGGAIFVLWNSATLIGAVGARSLAAPAVFGLDAAAPAAFLALLVPRLRTAGSRWIALGAAAVALGCQTVLPAGVPILLAGAITAVLAWPDRAEAALANPEPT